MNESTSPTAWLDPEARLKHAAYVGDLAAVNAALAEWLLAHGAPVEAKTIQGITPLASLFFGNHLNHVSPQAVALLYQHGADWSAPCGPAGQPRTCAQAYLAHDPDRAAPLLADWSAQQLAQQLQGANALPARLLERSRPRL